MPRPPLPHLVAAAILTLSACGGEPRANSSTEPAIAAATEDAQETAPAPPPDTGYETVFVDAEGCDAYQRYVARVSLNAYLPVGVLRQSAADSQKALESVAASPVGNEPAISQFVEARELQIGRVTALWDAHDDENSPLPRPDGIVVGAQVFDESPLRLPDDTELSLSEYDDLVLQARTSMAQSCIVVPSSRPTLPAFDDVPLPEIDLHVSNFFDQSLPRSLHFSLPDNTTEAATAGGSDLSPDQQTWVFVDSEHVLHIADALTGESTALAWAGELNGGSARWSQDGDRLFVERTDPSTGDGDLVTIDLATETATVHDTDTDDYLPFEYDPQTLVFSSNSELWISPPDDPSNGRSVLWADPTCSAVINPVRPSSGRIEFVATCDDPYKNGLYSIDPETGKIEHLIEGAVGIGALTSDETHRVFTYGPTGNVDDISLHVATFDISRVWDTGREYSFPVVLDDPDT